MAISDEEIHIARKMRKDLIFFAEKNLWIKPKVGKLELLKYNRAQLYFHERCEAQKKRTGKVRQIVVKGRQQGISTYVNSRFYHKTVWNEAILTFIFAHESKSSSALFDMAKRFYDNSDQGIRPLASKSNAYELLFPSIESGYKIGTAGSGDGIGRSRTFQNVHWSEVAYSDKPHDLAAGILATVPDLPDTEIILESTANGQGDYFHDIIMKAGDGGSFEDWEATFLPWYWQPEYTREVPDGFVLDDYETFWFECLKHDGLTLEHLNWRRTKLGSPEFNGDTRKFKREYPFTIEEAFEASDDESYIKAEDVADSLKTFGVPHNSVLIMGVDPAGLGKDDFGIVERAGRTVVYAGILPKMETDKSCDWLAKRINERKPLIVNIDTIGMGITIYDGLKARGFERILRKVNVAESANDKSLYHNKRAEIQAKGKKWFQDKPNSLAIKDQKIRKQLAQEVTYARAKYDNNNALQIEKKDEIKKRHKISPGLADAFFLTFANEVVSQDMDRVQATIGHVQHANVGFDPFGR